MLDFPFRSGGAGAFPAKHAHFVLQQLVWSGGHGTQQQQPERRAADDQLASSKRMQSFIRCSLIEWVFGLRLRQELSEDEDVLSMEEDDRADTNGRLLLHIPDSQRRPVRAAVAEIEWMLRDEIAAFLLDVFPVAEPTLQTVNTSLFNIEVYSVELFMNY